MEPWVPGLIAGTFAVVVAIVGGMVQIRVAARTARAGLTAQTTPGAPTVGDIWKRQDSMEKAFKAALVLLGESVEQHDNPGQLQFNAVAVRDLRESGYMPPELENVLSKSTEQGGN